MVKMFTARKLGKLEFDVNHFFNEAEYYNTITAISLITSVDEEGKQIYVLAANFEFDSDF